MANSNGNIFSFIPRVCYFSYHPSIAAYKTRSLTLLVSTKIREEKTVTRTSTHLFSKFVAETTIHHYCMLVKSFI